MQALLISALALAAQPDFEFSGAVPADGYLGAVKVPELPAGATEETHDLRFTITFDADVEGGGQNRSNGPHPGLEGGGFDGAQLALVTRLEGDGPPLASSPTVGAALPWITTSRAFKDWGPTQGDPVGPWPAPEQWPALYERGEPSIYWGPGSSTPPGPSVYGDVVSDDWVMFNEVAPGDALTVWFSHRWEFTDWPSGHAWPWAARLNARVTFDLDWVPAE